MNQRNCARPIRSRRLVRKLTAYSSAIACLIATTDDASAAILYTDMGPDGVTVHEGTFDIDLLIRGLFALLMCSTTCFTVRADVLISSLGERSVLQYDDDGNFIRTLVASGGGGLERPFGLLVVSNELLVVDDAIAPAVRRYDFVTGAYLGALIDNTQLDTLNAPDDILLTDTGELLLSNYGGRDVSRFDAATGEVQARFPVGLPNGRPAGMTLEPSGNLLVADRNGALWRHDWHNGTLVNQVLSGQGSIVDVALHPSGDILVTNRNSVLRIDAVTNELLGIFGETANLGDTFGLGTLPDGDLLVTMRAAGSVLRFDGASGAALGPFSDAGTISEPTYLLHVRSAPEPPSLVLLAAGAAGLAVLRRRRGTH